MSQASIPRGGRAGKSQRSTGAGAKARDKLRYSTSLVTQGKHKFYTLTMPSDVLARTCFVSTREADPKRGFQRLLDEKRASEIANYIDNGLGTIPNSIVLSAQQDAELRLLNSKTLEFNDAPKAFLILDGQHRVYGFSMTKTALRVPVVIYNGLSRKDESRLFIDINTKQRPVPNELLLDIKKLAEYETTSEQFSGAVFDRFHDDPSSPLLGMLSRSSRGKGKISRVTFYAAMKPLLAFLENSDPDVTFQALAGFITAFLEGCRALDVDIMDVITRPTVFKGFMLLFPDVAQQVKDRFGKEYTAARFRDVMGPMFSRLRATTFSNAGSSSKDLHNTLSKALRTQFSL
jgi:DGQHR domain-containing protein